MVAGLPKEANSMTKKYVLSIAVILVMCFVTGADSCADVRAAASATLNISVSIPPVQQLTVIEPAAVQFHYPWTGADQGEALVFNDVGRLLVKSNSDWTLSVSLVESHGFKVSIRPADSPMAKWVSVSEFSAACAGTRGSSELSWDVKIEKLSNVPYESKVHTAQFVFTVSHI